MTTTPTKKEEDEEKEEEEALNLLFILMREAERRGIDFEDLGLSFEVTFPDVEPLLVIEGEEGEKSVVASSY